MKKINKVILVIMDGIAEREEISGNAVKQASTPNLTMLKAKYPNTLLGASGADVGLPQGQMGNSEVGHLNIGSGRVIYTGLSLINKELRDGKFFDNKALIAAINHVKTNNSRLHIMGLLSHGGVHSSYDHIVALAQMANLNNVESIIHCFADGRDVGPKTFLEDINAFSEVIKKTNAKLGTISGRYYAMDRDQRWERVQTAYDTMIGTGDMYFSDPNAYVNDSYVNGVTDEFIIPALNSNYEKDEITVLDNDAIIFANFRPDRAREICHCFRNSEIYKFTPNVSRKNIFLTTMTSYEGIDSNSVAYPSIDIQNVLGKVVSDHKLKQLRIAETEKYAHVTFFFDGGRELEYQHETKILVASPKVATYDLQPEMSADEITSKLLEVMKDFDFIVVNYANGDMVGHTGNIEATIKAVEVVDKQIGKIYKKAEKLGFTLFITADHGNADEMTDENEQPITKHSNNKVPLIITSKKYKLLSVNGSLSNVAPTILEFMGLQIPSEMTGQSLLIKK